MKVRWTIEALNALDDIENYIARDNPERALTFVEELIEFGDSLGDFAYKGSQAKWTKDTSIKEIYPLNLRLNLSKAHSNLLIFCIFEDRR